MAVVGEALLGAVFGEVFAELRDAVKYFRNKGRKFNSTLEKLESNLENLNPVVEEIKELNEELDGRKDEMKRLIDKMKKADECIRECSKIKRWQRVFKTKYRGELTKLNEAIESFCTVDMPVQIKRDLLELKKICSEKKPVGVGLSCSVPPPPKFIVGLDQPLKELKTMLLKEGKEESLVLVTAPGGCGKTTLVKKLSQDKDIEGTSISQILCLLCVFSSFQYARG